MVIGNFGKRVGCATEDIGKFGKWNRCFWKGHRPRDKSCRSVVMRCRILGNTGPQVNFIGLSKENHISFA